VPERHGFTVRNNVDHLARRSIAHEDQLALQSRPRLTLPRPPHPIPTFVTMADAPPRNRTAAVLVLICPTAKAKYF
jgi:hypothetical protein